MEPADFKSESELRVNNLKQYISDTYSKNIKAFNKDFRKKLSKRYKFSEDQIDTKSTQLRQVLKGYQGRTFSPNLQILVEESFNLPAGILTKIRPTRIPGYIFVSCPGNTANILYSQLQANEIVDEVSILFGDVDLFIKVYGTADQIQKLITCDLYEIESIIINCTRTYFSLGGKSWLKYPAKKHPDYKPPKNRWCSS